MLNKQWKASSKKFMRENSSFRGKKENGKSFSTKKNANQTNRKKFRRHCSDHKRHNKVHKIITRSRLAHNQIIKS